MTGYAIYEATLGTRPIPAGQPFAGGHARQEPATLLIELSNDTLDPIWEGVGNGVIWELNVLDAQMKGAIVLSTLQRRESSFDLPGVGVVSALFDGSEMIEESR